jgi:FO synthase
VQWLLTRPLKDVMAEAAALRDRGHGHVVTFSPKVFLPVTRLCRDTCGYCTFAQPPQAGVAAYMTPEEVVSVAQRGAAAGCTEALFTLGDKPEAKWPAAAQQLAALGFESTVAYVVHLCRLVLAHTGLLPHINCGVLSRAELAALRRVSVSQGLMLESSAPALLERGGAHHACPDKEPAARMRVICDAGMRLALCQCRTRVLAEYPTATCALEWAGCWGEGGGAHLPPVP